MFLQQYSFAALVDIIPFAVFADRDIVERVADVYSHGSIVPPVNEQSPSFFLLT